MIIEKLHIDSFGGLHDFTLELSSGINIIEGPNEAGKTTIASFCAFILFGFEKSERTLRISLDDSAAGGYLEVNTGEKRYRIERAEAGRDRFKVVDLYDNTPCMKGSIPGEILLGVTAELFSHTAYISQAQGAYIDGSGVNEAIENILFSGDEAVSTQRAQKKLEDARIALLHKNEKGGQIADLKKERELLTARLRRASESNKKIILTENSLADARENLEENKLKRDEYDVCIKYNEADAALRSFDNLHTLRAKEAKLTADNKKIISDYTYADFIPDTAYAPRLKELDGEVRRLRGEYDLLSKERARHIASEPNKAKCEDMIGRIDELGGKDAILKKTERNSHKYNTERIIGFLLCFLFIVTIAGAAFLFLSGKTVYSFASAAASVAALITMGIVFNLSAAPRRDTDEILVRLDAENENELAERLDDSHSDAIRLKIYTDLLCGFNEKTDVLDLRLKDKQSELDSLLSKWGRTDVLSAISDAEAMYNISQNGLRELENCRNAALELDRQLTGYNEENIRESFKTLSEAYHSLKSIKESDKLNINTLKNNYDFYCKQNASLIDRCHLLENQLTELRAVTEKPAQLSDYIYALDEEIASAVKRHRAYVLAHEQLAAAVEGMHSNITPNLSEESGRLLKTITGGRYGELGIGSDMSMVYTVRGKNDSADTRSIDYMSAGTRDLAYISLRLALMDLIYRSSVPPVIFDESFARLDDRRLDLTLRLIAEYAVQHQVILLTSQKRDAVILNGIARFSHIVL
jgi:recombinational DNA repair ATPase RecF